MNSESNANNVQNDELCSDSKTGFNTKRTNRESMRKLQVKKAKTSVDEKTEIDDENQTVDTNANAEKKNGVSDSGKIIDDEENQNENSQDSKDGKSKGGKTSHVQNCVSKDPSPNGVNCENKSEQEQNSDLQECINDTPKHKDNSNISDDDNTKSEVSEKQSDSGATSMITDNANASHEISTGNKEKDLNENTEKNNVDSPKDLRPSEKMLGMSPETIVSDVGLPDKESVKSDSVASVTKSDKDANSEVSGKDAVQAKTNTKGRENDSSSHSSKPESGKKEGESSKKKKKNCEECGAKKGLKFQVHYQGKTRFLCSDACFKNFKTKQDASKAAQETAATSAPTPPTPAPAPAPAPAQPSGVKCSECSKGIPSGQGYYPVLGEIKTLCSEECVKKYHENNRTPKTCSKCDKTIEDLRNAELLTWETMTFCNEDCLGKYQSFLGSHCTCCQVPVQQASLGKYCVCFGADIRQFCSGSCLEEFKKGLKVCSFCQTDLSAGIDGFLAPVGDKGQFKDFCSPQCMERYEVMNNITKNVPQMQECSHCKKQGSFKIQLKHDNNTHSLCCDMCVSGFRCANKIKEHMCNTCYKFFTLNPEKEFALKYDGMHKHFCAKACMTLFVLSHRKIVPCIWCKVKKYNFDMIEKIGGKTQAEKPDVKIPAQVFCSLNCLSLFRVSVNASSSKSIRCDNCTKNLPAQYHLTMSDGSIRNFCCYQCVILFQNQFTNVPALTTTTTTRQTSTTVLASKTASATSTPVISNVISLAPSNRSVASNLVNKLVPQKLITARQPGPSIAVITKSQVASSTITSSSVASGSTTGPVGGNVVREVIVKPPLPKSMKNKTVSCKPIMQSKGISCKPQPCHKAVQTDDSPMPVILPIPVPIYVPTPVHMFSRPVPCPVPFPVPIPIPLIVPVSKDSPSQVIKHLKDIQEKIPRHPYEAELLMMAEKVAEDGGKEQSITKDKGQSKDKETSQEKNEEKSLNSLEASSDAVNESRPSTSFAQPSTSFDNPSTSYENASTSYDHSSKSYVEEQNVADDESEPDDEYVFKDSKSHHHRRHHHHHHHHGKRSGSHGKNKGRKKFRSGDAPLEEVEPHTASVNDEEPSTSYQNEQPQTVSPLKVP